jgi:hypothetical protein
MKELKVTAKQAQLLSNAQAKASQLSVLTQEANAQVRALLEIIAEAAGVPVDKVVSVDPVAMTISVLEDEPKAEDPE